MMGPDVEFTVKATMPERWAPQFLGLLREMQRLGVIGSSRTVRFYADGDGDYRPRFEWDTDVAPVDGIGDDGLFWDAG